MIKRLGTQDPVIQPKEDGLVFVGFRPGLDEYFAWVITNNKTRVPGESLFAMKQVSPFIAFGSHGTVAACWTVKDLTETWHGDTHVLQAWPGKYRTDIFHFQIKELLEYIKKGG